MRAQTSIIHYPSYELLGNSGLTCGQLETDYTLIVADNCPKVMFSTFSPKLLYTDKCLLDNFILKPIVFLIRTWKIWQSHPKSLIIPHSLLHISLPRPCPSAAIVGAIHAWFCSTKMLSLVNCLFSIIQWAAVTNAMFCIDALSEPNTVYWGGAI